jgi:hypothetical protein
MDDDDADEDDEVDATQLKTKIYGGELASYDYDEKRRRRGSTA